MAFYYKLTTLSNITTIHTAEWMLQSSKIHGTRDRDASLLIRQTPTQQQLIRWFIHAGSFQETWQATLVRWSIHSFQIIQLFPLLSAQAIPRGLFFSFFLCQNMGGTCNIQNCQEWWVHHHHLANQTIIYTTNYSFFVSESESGSGSINSASSSSSHSYNRRRGGGTKKIQPRSLAQLYHTRRIKEQKNSQG